MDLRELGALFKEERERRGLSHNDVIDKIKIGRACLLAIEEGDESGMPHPVYAKGFIKNYAKLLDLDPEEVGDAFSRSLGTIPESRIATQHELSEPVSAPRGFSFGGGPFRYVLVGLVLLLVVAGVLWSFSLPPFEFSAFLAPSPAVGPASSGDAGSPVPETPPSSPQAGKSGGGAPLAGGSEQTGSAGILPVVEPAPPVPIKPLQPAPEAAQSAPPVPETTAQARTAVTSPDAEEPADPSLLPDVVHGETGAHSVSIVATEESWIDVAADGGPPKGVMLTKGKRFIGRFNESLLVRLGNAAGVKIQYDDKDYPLQANPGEVKTLKFVAKQNAAPATSTPQANQTASSTAPAKSPAAPAAPKTEPTMPASTPAAAPEAAARPDGMRQVEIVGTDGSWVIVIPDGGKPREIFVKKGQTITEPYKDTIEIKLGNPSSVLFRHEGQEYPMSTQQGEKKSVRFPNP
ncbi:RodZ domain-containing protein [Desulfolutivibrio sulfoxidireducens]|uniref:RodZ domain-containing protein n=1 Tax=Desulfolutivibrio sulfoxidireducens TaxID=2773299 RepID=UPI00159D8CF2|nr:RodZ domain-containing protein [Desulfolutivibrio sulfoxidireducens]QLA19675.1 DUF4115 domain-containing protein [Desulfolutivibrio sulfoxidireducens]